MSPHFLRLALGLLLCLPPLVQAAGPDCSRSYTLALHEHGLLYNASSRSGIDKDVADELIRRSGCHVEISLLPRSRIWKLLETGNLDFSLSGITNEERERFAAFAWYFADKYSLIVRKDAAVQNLADFQTRSDLKLGGILSFRYSDTINQLVDALDHQGRLIGSYDYDTLYQNLRQGRTQAIIIEPFDYSDLDKYQVSKLVHIMETNDQPTPHGLIMSRKTIAPEQQERWREIINSMRRDGSMLKIFRKYFSREEAQQMMNF
ncbi:substrate-binding periplasmic protein [Aquitalea magnusonii]|uniref:Amino acid ABC transporter substrate-binding protein (PAAT family) n=1 Tax=Aquitalea magnusonii TaxID=332411 RepID=A0A318J538_9NEIS|nr:transporter substrate-binding domain-containing protein [Aquitalea magnusonii]PXX42770.1 amino acid ABC transporter substrate-binding protein (PAAT family) [Aquitalea magnusonii]